MSNYIWIFLEKFLVIVVKFISMMLMARLITPEDYGIFTIANVLIMTAAVVVDSGMASSLIRKKDLTGSDYHTVLTFNIVTSLLVSAVLYVGSGHIANYYNIDALEELIKALSICVIFRGGAGVYIASVMRQLKFKGQAIIMLSAALFASIVAIIFAVLYRNYWALVVQQVVEAGIIYFLFKMYAAKDGGEQLKGNFSSSLLKEHAGFGMKLTASSFLDMLSTTILLSYFAKKMGVNFVGKYTQVSRINEIFVGVSVATIDKAAFPVLAKLSASSKEFTNYLYELIGYICLVSYAVLVIMICCSKDIILIVLGDQWIDSAWILSLVAFCGFGQMIEVPFRSALKAFGSSGLILAISLIKLTLVFSILLIFVSDTSGNILYGLIVISMISPLIYVLVSRFYIEISSLQVLRKILKPTISAFITILLYKGLYGGYIKWEHDYLVLSLVIDAICIVFVYIYVLFLMKTKDLVVILSFVASYCYRLVSNHRAGHDYK